MSTLIRSLIFNANINPNIKSKKSFKMKYKTLLTSYNSGLLGVAVKENDSL